MSGLHETSEKVQETRGGATPAPTAEANGTAAGTATSGEAAPETPAAAGAEAGEHAAEGGEKKLSKNALKKRGKRGGGEGGARLLQNALKKLAKSGGKKKEKKQWAEPAAGGNKPKKEKKAEVAVSYEGPRDGTKKDASGDMPSTYQPAYVEAAWQEYWEKAGFYTCDPAKAASMPEEKKFIMVIPPPNVTGSLHLGHALTAAIQDTLTRWHRMLGHATLYVPGTDHAGIATQSVVEKKLKRDQNITRHDLGRDEFVNRVWQWKDEYGGKITNQIRKLGSSVDWSREAFTMDANLSRAVTEAFCRFHESGLIYRDTRLGNWSCALKSAISDIEVDYVDLEGRTFMAVPGHTLQPKYEFGTMTQFAYRVEGGQEGEELVVATTRLETMLGDTGVAVHPKDERYKTFHGKTLVHPFTDRKIPVVLDDVLVDMALGTGAVKITPAHDPNDYLCGKRHGLPFITVLGLDGAMNSQAGEFEGMMRYDARVAVEKALEAKGLLRGKDPHKMRLGVCSRSGDIIEPMITPQWYVKCDGMAQRAVDAVKNGELRIEPSMHEKTWYSWLENSRDWCISRQLWWGHRIPAYFVTAEGEGTIDKTDLANKDRWVVARSPDDAKAKAAAVLGCEVDKVHLSQDEDVLDTWFSSGLFPFSVFGWPDVDSEDLKAFFPTTLLETGMDILFFWVARMVMMSLELNDVLPFKTVYLHAMVRDKFGRKMSKTLGNVIDPLEVIHGCDLETLHKKLELGNLPAKEMKKAKEGQKMDFPDGIPECGADALRFGLLAYTVQGRDVNLDISRVIGYRNFCNKLWNAVRFALTYITDITPPLDLAAELIASIDSAAPRDRWILSRLNFAVSECNRCLAEYKFGDATQVAYSFWLYDLCDTYLELIKPVVGDMSDENKKVGIRGVPVDTLDNTFIDMIIASVDKPLPITVYNYKSMTMRDVTITPSKSWGGQGMLGVTIRFDTYHNADENLVRVLEVVPGSPSHIAGLQPEHDYLLGTAERVFKDPDILFEEVTAHLDQPMSFYVYNTQTDEVRIAVVLPTNMWGGEGCLGAEVGHGYLHRLPQSCRSSTATSVVKGMSFLAVDATGGGSLVGKSSSNGASRTLPDPSRGGGESILEGSSMGPGGALGKQGAAGASAGAREASESGGAVIDVDLSG